MCLGCDVLIIVFHPVPEDDVWEVHSCDRWMSSVIFLYTPRYIRPAGNSDITTIYYQHQPARKDEIQRWSRWEEEINYQTRKHVKILDVMRTLSVRTDLRSVISQHNVRGDTIRTIWHNMSDQTCLILLSLEFFLLLTTSTLC